MATSELKQLAFLLRLAAMTGREIAERSATGRDEIRELADRAEDLGNRLDDVAKRQPKPRSKSPTGPR